MKNIWKTGCIILLATVCSGFPAFSAQQPEPPGTSEHPEPPGRTENLQFFFSGENQAWLGVELADVTSAKVQELKLPGEYGAIVTRVMENSPAAKAGLKVNDVIVSFAGMRVWSVSQLRQLVQETPPGREAGLQIIRNGHRLDLKATLARRDARAFFPHFNPPEVHFPRSFNFHFNFAPARLGIRGEDLTPQLASYFGVKQGKGVLVAEVDSGSPAAKAGLKAGDCITKAGSKEIASVSDLRRALDTASSGQQPVTLQVVRDRHEETLTVKLEPLPKPAPEQQVQEYQRTLRQIEKLQEQLPHLQQVEQEEIERIKKQLPYLQQVERQRIEALKKQLPQLQETERRMEQRIQELETKLNSQIT